MYINTKTKELQESIEKHEELCTTGNKLLRAINAQFPRLKCKLNRDLLFEFFNGRQSPGEREFHRYISEKDILADIELQKKLEAEGRTLDVIKHLELYPLNPFREATNELIRSFYYLLKTDQFRCYDKHIVEVDSELKMSDEFEDFITGVFSTKLEDKTEIDLYQKAQGVAAILSEFLKEVKEANSTNRQIHIDFDELFSTKGTEVKPTRSVIPRLLEEKIDLIVATRQRSRREHEGERDYTVSPEGNIGVRTMFQVMDSPDKLKTGKQPATKTGRYNQSQDVFAPIKF